MTDSSDNIEECYNEYLAATYNNNNKNGDKIQINWRSYSHISSYLEDTPPPRPAKYVYVQPQQGRCHIV